MRPATRYVLGIVAAVHATVGLPAAAGQAAAQAAKPDACVYVDAAQMLKMTGRDDIFRKGPQVQDPSEIPQYTSGCHFLGVLFLLNEPFAPDRFARARKGTETGGLLKVESVSGLGDEAYFEWDPRPGDFRSVGLVIRSGNKRLTIADETHADSIETVKKWFLAIGKTAAPKMK